MPQTSDRPWFPTSRLALGSMLFLCLLPACPEPAAEDGDDGQAPTWSDVPCGDTTCTGTQICVQPGLNCDFGPCMEGMQAQWVSDPAYCAPYPEQCSTDDPECPGGEYCTGSDSLGNSFDNGQLECGPIALDCFC